MRHTGYYQIKTAFTVGLYTWEYILNKFWILDIIEGFSIFEDISYRRYIYRYGFNSIGSYTREYIGGFVIIHYILYSVYIL